MTSEKASLAQNMVPFVFRYAERLPQPARFPLRYDVKRQIAQVLMGSTWVDARDVPAESMPSTRLTRVNGETTDDE
jgi:hypothetical protein